LIPLEKQKSADGSLLPAGASAILLQKITNQ
jgi:hypothetical protein